MNHIIPDLQLIEVLDLLPLIELFLRLLFLLRAENIRLREDNEADHRIFKALRHMTVIGQHLARLNLSEGILRVHCRDVLVPQILREPFCPGP